MRKVKEKTLVFLTILLFIFLAVVTGCTEKRSTMGEDFSFTSLDGETKHLSDFYGKIILVDFMAVNCQPCVREMLELKKISENYSADEVMILSIDVWVAGGENAELLGQFITAFHNQLSIDLNWTFGLDDAQGTIQKKYASGGVPTLYIFDKKGNIYYSHVGYEKYQTLASKLDAALGKV